MNSPEQTDFVAALPRQDEGESLPTPEVVMGESGQLLITDESREKVLLVLPAQAAERGDDARSWRMPTVAEAYEMGVPFPKLAPSEGFPVSFSTSRGMVVRARLRLLTIVVNDRGAWSDLASQYALFAALDSRQAAIEGCNHAVDRFSRHWLGIRKVREWREAVSTALMGDWVNALGDGVGDAAVVRSIQRESHTVHRQLQPLWERKVRGNGVNLLDKPVGEGLTLGDLVTDGQQPEDEALRDEIDDPRLLAVLAALDPVEREVVRAWAYGEAENWQQAAQLIEVENAEAVGERVRRKLRRLGLRHSQREMAAELYRTGR